MAVVGLRHLGHNFTLVDVFFQRQQNLVGVDGLDEVVGNLGPDGLVHDVFLLALGHHHHGQVGADVLDALQGFEPAQAGHVLVQQHQVEILLLTLLHGIVSVGQGRHLVSLLFQKYNMGLEHVDLIVHPKQFSVGHICIRFFLWPAGPGTLPPAGRYLQLN